MASSGIKFGKDHLDVKRTPRSDVSTVNSDTETANNEEEDDDVETSNKHNTRPKRQATKKKVVRRRRITANIAATKYDVGKA